MTIQDLDSLFLLLKFLPCGCQWRIDLMDEIQGIRHKANSFGKVGMNVAIKPKLHISVTATVAANNPNGTR